MNEFLKRISSYSPKRLALLAAQQREQLDRLEARDPIAIVGIGCRFPGGSDSPEAYWEFIESGADAIREVPADRWDVDALYDPDPDAPGKMATRWGSWLDRVDQFDANFFGIAPREAQSLDPQQRLLLEVVWAALEDAGIPSKEVFGTRTGVFCGISGNDYHGILRDADMANYDAYTASGIAHSMASGRISYVLGAMGPSISVDTACSSSLVAIHEAVQALRRKDCDMALAGGVNLILTPETTVALSRSHMMAPDGHCKTFDARADGFVRGEGCGILVLKRLSAAKKDGDRVVAVIRGSGINQDGRSNGLTAPNGAAQEAVLAAALADAGLQGRDVGFVEAHGTGTSLGDPIEVHALGEVLGRDRAGPLKVGSIKSAMGHLESSAGVAGLIKAALALKARRLPGQVNLQDLNPLIQWDKYPVEPQRETVDWPADLPQVAGVSSFGFSGTNVHILLEPAPEPAPAEPASERPRHILTLSARSEASLDALIEARRADLVTAGALPDIAFTANAGRDHFPHRIAIVADTRDEAEALLKSRDKTDLRYATGTAPSRAPKIAFVFTGQGAQYPGMADELYAAHPVFRSEIDRCAEILGDRLPVPLLSVIDGSAADVEDTAIAQPALFAVEWALAKLWQSWGIEPSAVLGHSLGEYVAACVAGVFSLEDGLMLVSERGRLMAESEGAGAMSAVRCDAARAAEIIAPWTGQLDIAAVNGPQAVVISGAAEALDAADAAFEAAGIQPTRLKVSHAFHSPLMEPILDAFERVVAGVTLSAPQIPLISNVTGKAVSREVTEPRYWREHVRKPVRFADGIAAAAETGARVFLEVGPHPSLMPMAQATLDPDRTVWLPSLRRGESDMGRILASLAQLYVQGAPVDWRAFDAPWPRKHTTLAGYPFDRTRFWVDTPPARKAEALPTALPGRELLHSLGDTRLFQLAVDTSAHPWLADQRTHGRQFVPSTFYMDWAWQIARLAFGDGPVTIRNFALYRTVEVGTEPAQNLQLALDPAGESAGFRISALQEDGSWTVLCDGQLAKAASALDALPDAPMTDAEVAPFYARLGELGLDFGPSFRALETLQSGDGAASATVSGGDGTGHMAHPAVLDSALHVIGAALPLDTLATPYMVFAADEIAWHGALAGRFRSDAAIAGTPGDDTLSAEVRMTSNAGAPLVSLSGVTLRRASAAAFADSGAKGLFYRPVWRRDAAPAAPERLVGEALPEMTALAAEASLETTYGDFLTGLDAVSAAYVAQALRTLGAPLAEGDALTADGLMGTAGIDPRHRRLIERMFAMLAEDGFLAEGNGSWTVSKSPPESDPEAEAEALMAAHPEGSAELELTRATGRDLAGVLKGDTDPLTLLFPDGSLDLTRNVYANSPPSRVYTEALANVVGRIGADWPEGRPLRILEIGAGTASATVRILDRLGKTPISYTFTDISPLFLNRAKSRFADRDDMEFRALDISLPPAGQGFEPGSFDVILAGNVIHATPDLTETLGHVTELLAPEGLLVMLEGTATQRFGDLTVGLLDGWWAYSDTDLRSYALMPRDRWMTLFGDLGFRDAAALPRDDAGGALAEQAIFVARRPIEAQAGTSWLILTGGGLETGLKAALEATGDTVTVLAGDLASALVGVDRVVDLTALDTELAEGATSEALVTGQKAQFDALLAHVHALGSHSGPAPALTLVTRGAQATDAREGANPAQATVWGFSHTLELEHPEFACRRVDLDPGADPDPEALAAELRRASEPQVALRGDTRLLRRIAHEDMPSTGTPALNPERTCLIPGGLGGLGLAVADWLAGHGARHLALMGRSDPTDAAREAIAALEAQGVSVRVLKGDISVEGEIARCMDEIADMPPVGLVIHASGALADGALVTMDWPQVETVMKAKVIGSWRLMQAVPEDARFVMFSSGASLAGSPGQANHSAANAFQDALASWMRARGRDAVAINWGLWGEIGAGADIAGGYHGLRPISPEAGLAAFGAILADTAASGPQIAVIDADWREVAELGASSITLSELLPKAAEAKTDGADTRAPQAADLGALIDGTPKNRRRAVLVDAIRGYVRKVLGAPPDDPLDVTEPLQQRGLDSLMAVELRNVLGGAVGRTLPATLIFDHPTITALADYLGTILTPPEPEAPPEPEPEPEEDDLDDLSDEDLALQLALQLDRLDTGSNS